MKWHAVRMGYVLYRPIVCALIFFTTFCNTVFDIFVFATCYQVHTLQHELALITIACQRLYRMSATANFHHQKTLDILWASGLLDIDKHAP